jgi:UPF0716 protein FxsA
VESLEPGDVVLFAAAGALVRIGPLKDVNHRYPGRVILLAACLFFVAEVAAFVAVGDYIGFGWAVLLLIGISALGPFLVKRVGLGVLGRTQDRLAQGDLPTRELLDGVVVLVGGMMICVPGFISDALGLLLMIGPFRHLLIRFGGRRLAGQVQTMGSGRWSVIDARTRSTSDMPGPTSPRQPMIEPHATPGGSRAEP